MLADSFSDYVESLEVDNLEDIDKKYKRITKKLNQSFWDLESDEEHAHKVGSLGRGTAIKGVSDLDMLFILPDAWYTQYNNHEGNGQSKLLQRVKEVIRETYPRTIVRGDGQVVVVSFSNYQIEVCPCFSENDGSFTYPDANSGGKWKKTDPIPEIRESLAMTEETGRHYCYLCNMLRAWKNETGFKFGGLLIDTLVYDFFEEYTGYKECSFEDYLSVLKDLFAYLKNQSETRKYWFALGSNQQVYDKKKIFIKKAKKAHEKLDPLSEDSEDIYDILQELFGQNFPVPEELQEITKSAFASYQYANNEQFIEELFPVDIRYNLTINANILQAGFREGSLSDFILKRFPLKTKKQLKFCIEQNETDELELSYTVYWKVRNVGIEAVRRNMIRGEISQDTGNEQITETTDFRGSHYVECYIIHNGVCVAKDRIKVPIAIA
ncbi:MULTISPECIES: SMODS domain-containing nucleotidyltransferase [Bacillus cereus group]|uniref:SMODS domain-containing nucleotidyltransferase n=1 Tax=Bacillus cereus group TaxID=86661 RepID=UPI0018F74420|nr:MULTISPECIES: nucleotidyltransferase [Bacillus cereus group]MBJ8091528.1 nucleotidyltransferase [Bacillus cereus]CAH2464926.1 tRNA cytidylyltransferase activity [Bacillus mycoides KBAB4]